MEARLPVSVESVYRRIPRPTSGHLPIEVFDSICENPAEGPTNSPCCDEESEALGLQLARVPH